MRPTITAVLLLTLLASSSLWASAPPIIWFQDNFDSDPLGRLVCCPGWQQAQVIEPGTTSPWSIGTTDVNVKVPAAPPLQPACSGLQCVVMQGYQGGMGYKTLWDPAAACAQTNTAAPPVGVSWAAQAAGNVQILHFKMKRACDELADPPLHAAVFLMDNNPFGAQPIMGWVASTHSIKAQLYLPTYMGPNWTTNRYYSPEGSSYTFPLNNDCHEFTAVYYPSDGTAEFYVDRDTNPTPLCVLNAGASRVSRSVYVRDFIWHGGNEVDIVLLDDLAVGTSPGPAVIVPANDMLVNTQTPTIAWQRYSTGRISYQVRVCTADNPDSYIYDSGVLTDSATTHVPTSALPLNQRLWAYVRETYPGESIWSGSGNGGFRCVIVVPGKSTLTYPSGMVVGLRPSVTFSNEAIHNQFECKITTASNGSGTPVWTSGTVDSTHNGAACSVTLAPGTQYYAFARAGNPLGWGAWSDASPFQVTHAGEAVDARHMDETWPGDCDGRTYCKITEHSAAVPDDGFADHLDPGYVPGSASYDVVETGGNSVLYVATAQGIPGSEVMLRHRVAGLSLDKGVTLVTRVRNWNNGQPGSWNASSLAHQAQAWIMDDYGTGKCMAAFRVSASGIGILADGATWQWGSWSWGISQYHLIRITGRNRIVGDPTTAEWKYYFDDSPSPYISATGSIDQSAAPDMGANGPITDGIAIGQACYGLRGYWYYDWTAVNTDGDYAPAEWVPVTAAYDTISEAANGGGGTQCAISGEGVITGVLRTNGSQTGFWVQDVNSQDRMNVYIPSTNTQNVEVGHKVTGISGLLYRQDGVRFTTVEEVLTLRNAACTVTAIDVAASPVAMAQKTLVSGGTFSDYPKGTNIAGRFVRIVGKITQKRQLTDGTLAVYVDDGSGLVDQRNLHGADPLAVGLRIQVDSPSGFPFAIGDFVRVDGICAYEVDTALVDGLSKIKAVSTILAPTFVEIE